LIRLQNVQTELDRACDALFKPSGSKPLINQAIKSIKTARKDQKASLLRPKTWQSHDLECRQAQKQMEKVKAALVSHKQHQARLARIHEALPLIARKKEIDTALEGYQGVPELADDFGEKRRDAEKDLKMAVRDVERLQAAIENLSRKISALPVPRALTAHAAAIESLQHELGSFRKAQKDRPSLDGRMRTLQKQAADTLAEISQDISGRATDELKLPPSTVSEIRELGKQYERVTAQQDSATRQQRKWSIRFNQLTAQRRAMATPVNVFDLENALQSALAAGPIEKQLDQMRSAGRELESELSRALKRQTLWRGALAQIDELPLPSKATIDRFDARFDALRRAIDKSQESLASAKSEIAQTQAEIQAIDLSQEVPTETDLKNIRAKRDQGWQLLRQQLAGHMFSVATARNIWPHIEHASDLAAAFEAGMRQCDHIADRLRREADQVSRKGLLEARKTKFAAMLCDIEAALETNTTRQTELKTEWRQLWAPAGIAPQTPREMCAWLSEIEMLRGKLLDRRARQSQSEALAAQLAALKSDMMTALAAAGVSGNDNQPLSRLIKTAQARIHTQKQLESEISAADKELISLKSELEEGALALAELEGALAQWKSNWQAGVDKIGIRADTNPTAALAVIESIRDVREKTGQADVLRKRIKGIDRDADEFMSRVDELIEILAPDLRDEPRDRAAESLNGRLTDARKNESKLLDLTERLETARQELEAAERRSFECLTLIDALCRQANCPGVEALAEVEKRARQRSALTRELGDIARQLRKLSAGATVEAFIDEAASIAPDSIRPELQELEDASQKLETERSELDQKIGALKATLAQMDGRSEAAMHAEHAERLLAGLESDVEKYARLKIAAILLTRTVEQYREKHQGPLIARAGDFFAQMTLNGFSRLRADYDDKGNPVLVGIRAATHAPVSVEGMSDGTADQLYLALRLASFEQYLENNEPLPFVVDDILLRFDDQRALATLDVLAGLAEKTQVLFFTHHRHLVALAENAGDKRLKFNLHHL